ncbi:hypothetical protein SNE40_019236 [Patella caerulea]|uniref:Vacuolar protein sorting-associated protein 13 n=1 Tax=Patella caerulea TaxID=87958 RepID=A0AAN8JAB1_PATCE
MFESLVVNLLNKHFGKYIQNLDSSNLNISILQGDAEFTDLQLRPEALAELDLPVEVKAGYVGRLKIDIPWTSLFTSDIQVWLEDVYMLVGPIADRQYDHERERQLQNAVKRQKLESLEKSTLETVADKAEQEPGFYEKLSTHFINHIQVSIRNIHIRYEDTVTNVDHPFAFGIMLKQIYIKTTDAKWKPTQADNTSNMLHKLMRLEDLSVYWNPYIPEHHLLRSRLNTDGWRNLLRISIDSHSIFEEDFDFIIEPVTAQARLILSTENNFSLPKVFVDFMLEELEVLLSRQQFLNLLSLSDSFQMMSINQRYRKYHPNVPLKVSPRSWWKYAYTSILEEVIRPFSWERIKEHRAKYKKYKDMYKKSLEQPDHESIKSKLLELEEGLDVANILIAREQAKVEFTYKAPERARKKKKEKGWWSSWFGGDEEEEEIEVEIDNKDKDWLAQLTEEEKAKLYNGIGYDVNANTLSTPKEYVAHKVQIVLKSCCVSLVNYSKKILQMSVTNLLTSLENRPGADAIRISTNTESFSIEGASIEHELIPILTSDIGVYAPAVNQVFTLDFQTRPVYIDADYSLNLNVQPVEIVYDEHSISEVAAFFQVPHGVIDMKSAAMETLQNLGQYSRAGLQYAIEQHKTVHLVVNMRSPYIVVPEFGTLHRGGNVLIVDFGKLQIESELQPKDVSLEDATMSEIESRLYDQFNVNVTDVKVLLADSGDDWHTAQTQADSEYHILPSVRLTVAFFNAVKQDYTQLPRQKMIASIPTLKVNISDKRLLLLMSFFRNFPMPTSTSMATLGDDLVDGMMNMVPSVVSVDMSNAQVEPDISYLRRIRRSVLGRIVMEPIKRKNSTATGRQSQDIPVLRISSEDENFYSASDNSDEEIEEWADIIKIKPVDDNSSQHNPIKVLIRMTLGEFVINLSRVLDTTDTPYLMFRLDRMRVDTALTECGYAVHATLGGIQMVDKVHVGSSGEYMEVLNTQSNSDLIALTYRMVKPTCPDFDSLYGSVEHSILVKFKAMSALFDQASMIYLNVFIKGLISGVHNMDMKTSTSTVTSDFANKDRASFTQRLSSITGDEVDNLPSKGIKVNFVAQLNSLCIKFSDCESSFAELNISDFQGHVVAKSTRTTLRCRLKDMSILDTSVGAIFPKILMLEDDNSVFDLKLIKYNKSEELRSDNKHKNEGIDYSIRVRVGQFQTVCLGKFYWELARFFEPFINREMTEAARAAAVETVAKQVGEIEEQNLRITLRVDLKAPTILLPQHAKSTEMFLLNLGDLSIKNYYDFTVVTPDIKQEWNHIYLNLSSMQAERVQLCLADDVCNVLHTVIEPVSLKADVRVAMKPVVSDVRIDISGHIDKVKIKVFKKDLQLMMAILRENFIEGAPQTTKQGIYESPTMQNIPQVSMDTNTTPSVELRDMTSSTSISKSSTNMLFRLDGITATLLEETTKDQMTVKRNLCGLEMDNISLNGIYHNDGDLKLTFNLQSIAVNDTRPDSKLANKRVLYCAEKSDATSGFPLVSLIYKISSDGHHKADLMVEKLQLNVHIQYQLLLIDFLLSALQTPSTIQTTDSQYQPVSQSSEPTTQTSSLNFYGTLKQPRIVLFTDPTSEDSRVIIMNADVAFEYRTDAEKQNMWSKISNLQIISKLHLHQQPQSQIVAPCSLEFSQTIENDKGEKIMNLKISKIDVILSAVTMQLVWDVYQMVQWPTDTEPTAVPEPSSSVQNNLWNILPIDGRKWSDVKNTSIDSDGPKNVFRPAEKPIEMLKVEISDVNVLFEVENLDLHVPLLWIKSSVDVKICDWTLKLHLESECHLEMLFFNEELGVWEPLVEPVFEHEGVYRPWEVLVKLIKAPSFPMACTYEDNDLDVPDGLQNEVQQMMHRSRMKSSSSETDTDSSTDMTVIRHKSIRRLRNGSNRNYAGSSDVNNYDTVDGINGDDDVDQSMLCTYIIMDSQDTLQLNVTNNAIGVISDVIEALTKPNSSSLASVRHLPAFQIDNKLGVHCFVTLHPELKVHEDMWDKVTVFRGGAGKDNRQPVPEADTDLTCDEADATDGLVGSALASMGHNLISAGAFVFDDDDDYLSGENVDQQRLRLQVEGFEPLPTLLHKRACRKLFPLTPRKNGIRYCTIMNVDMTHGRKVISYLSPLKVKNYLTISVDISCKTEDLKQWTLTSHMAKTGEYTKLATISPDDVYYLPLFVAYNCPVFVTPSDLGYEQTYNSIWWKDLIQEKEKHKYFICQSEDSEKKNFNMKVTCEEGDALKPVVKIPRNVPYYNICLYPPVTLHNYLPYDINFSLEGASMSSLTHGDQTPLYTVDLNKTSKLFLHISDYLGSEWTGNLDITGEMEQFKAISMETDVDEETVNKHLSLSIHSDLTHSLDVYIYCPYWIINKTELPLHLRGSNSEVVLDIGPVAHPMLFRFKKHTRKKAKLRLYDSRWSQSFSMDTVGSCGVIVCHDKERGRKHMFMVQSQMSRLQLTKIVTILPFFLVVNCSSRKLRFMEENEAADLWFDINTTQYVPFWPVTDSYTMFVKYENSTVTSQHFPIKKPHNTVLRMDQGSAICVEVVGGTDSPISITFRDYERGDAPVSIHNLCEDVFIKVHQKNQSQVTLLSANQSVLYTWDEPVAERTLMWNVYGRKRPSYPAFINRDGFGEVRLEVQSMKKSGSVDIPDSGRENTMESSPEDESDETDGLFGRKMEKSLAGRTRTDKMVIYWVSYLEGQQRILLFLQDERIAKAVRKANVQSIDLLSRKGIIQMNEGEQTSMVLFASFDGLLVSIINGNYDEVALLGICSSPAMWEVEVNGRWKMLSIELATWLEDQWKNQQVMASLQDQIEADLVKMQMSKPFMGSLRRTYNPGVWLQYRQSEHHQAVHAKVQRLQIDNQLSDAYFPTVLYPSPLPPYIMRKTGPKPFIEVGIMRRSVPEKQVDTIRYMKILVQEFNIRIDKGFMLSVYDVFAQLQKVEEESTQLNSDLLLAQRSLQEVASVMLSTRPHRTYYEYLHLSPLKLHVSFSLNGTPHLINTQPSSLKSDIVDFFLNSVGATFTEMKAVELRMAYFQRKGALLSSDQLLAQIQSHYTQQALQQAYVLILGLDVLGNPYGLVRDFTQGFGDFFYEPFLGTVQGSDDFAESLARGVQSLVGNTVGGAAGSVAMVTGSVGNALAVLSFDNDYRRKRRARMQQQPKHLPASLIVAARSLVIGLGVGFSGIILDPVKGANEEGVEGFFKGVGKGILGLLTKPAGGVIDMVSMAFDGIRRAAESEEGVVARTRLPRFINPAIGLRPYSPYRATGKRLLETLRKAEFVKGDIYWSHAPLSKEEKADIFMLTDRHLMIVERCRFWGGWEVCWHVNIDDLLGVPAIVEDKLIFKIRQDDGHVSLFGGSEKEVKSPEADILPWIQKQVELVIKYRVL